MYRRISGYRFSCIIRKVCVELDNLIESNKIKVRHRKVRPYGKRDRLRSKEGLMLVRTTYQSLLNRSLTDIKLFFYDYTT